MKFRQARQRLHKSRRRTYISSMLRSALLALLLLVSPALAAPIGAETPPTNGWKWEAIDGYPMLIPPPICMIGHLPHYSIIDMTQAEMDDSFLGPNHPGLHVLGKRATVDGQNVIYLVTTGLPPRVVRAAFLHETAHLRGCQHGNVFSD